MPRSMTGYGFARAAADGLGITVEVRSVNNRFSDISIRTPRALFHREGDLRKLVQEKVKRGRVSLFVNEDGDGGGAPVLRVNRVRARQYVSELQDLARELGLGGEVRIEHLLSLEDLFTPVEDEEYRERLWQLTRKAAGEALNAMLASAEREGEVLAADMLERVGRLKELLEQVREHSRLQVQTYRERLKERLEELLGDDRLDPARLEAEIVFAADKLDITEEMVRLGSHIGMFEKTIGGAGPVGKTLGFILQEMGRETNTIASKVWMVEISQLAIRMKELQEQVREQMQNLE